MAVSVAMILGPLWASTADHLYIMLGGLTLLGIVALSAVGYGWRRLDPVHISLEKTPLIVN